MNLYLLLDGSLLIVSLMYLKKNQSGKLHLNNFSSKHGHNAVFG